MREIPDERLTCDSASGITRREQSKIFIFNLLNYCIQPITAYFPVISSLLKNKYFLLLLLSSLVVSLIFLSIIIFSNDLRSKEILFQSLQGESF